ncbi:hypothetical protein PENSPDRAFT_657537 [Peniophora sp. CONT]|nr:hypothetical protein PENSPDRAFT_657537 [Peniophora sp. CONT]
MESLLRILRERSQNLSIQFGRIDQLSIKDEYHKQRWSQGQGVAELVELYGILSDAQSVRITCSGAFLTSTALALGHLTGTEYPFPALRRLRLASWHERKKFPSPKEIIAWLELRIKAGAGPSTLRLECYEGQDRNVVVDPELLALVPDTRYVESEDPDSEEDW